MESDLLVSSCGHIAPPRNDALFFLALVRITIHFITIRKIKKLMLLNIHLLVFALLYLVLFVFIFAYTIQRSSDERDIDQGYSNYYLCLIQGGGPTCSLDPSLSDYNLVMLKGWATSSLGLLLAFLFCSWDLIIFWFQLVKTFGCDLLRRSPNTMLHVAQMVVSQKSSISMSASLTVSSAPHGKEEEKEEEEAQSCENEQSLKTSSSSNDDCEHTLT